MENENRKRSLEFFIYRGQSFPLGLQVECSSVEVPSASPEASLLHYCSLISHQEEPHIPRPDRAISSRWKQEDIIPLPGMLLVTGESPNLHNAAFCVYVTMNSWYL
ncbi:uncharacterized protein RBU33_004345 isoform 3-T4 [Hipposideros larvatus]